MASLESKHIGKVTSQTQSTIAVTSKKDLNISSKASLDITSKKDIKVESRADGIAEIEALAGAFSACKIDNWKEALYNRQ